MFLVLICLCYGFWFAFSGDSCDLLPYEVAFFQLGFVALEVAESGSLFGFSRFTLVLTRRPELS